MKRGTMPAKTENSAPVWLMCLALITIGLGPATAFALDPMGPPLAEVEKGQFRAGLDYSFSDMDIELGEAKFDQYVNGVLQGSGDGPSVTFEGFKPHKGYASVGYGIFNNWEAFLRLGAATANSGGNVWDLGEEFDGSIDFAVGGGIKATFYEGFYTTIGGLAQVNYTRYDGNLSGSDWSAPDFVEIDLAELQVALGVTYMWTPRLSVYAGPFAYFAVGNFEGSFSTTADDITGLIRTDYSRDIDEGPTFGGYVGARIKITEDRFFNIEYQQTADAGAVGAGLMFRF
ncbi:MAG: hypothetical protein ABIF19_15080 [Planctomycetota bacterium]